MVYPKIIAGTEAYCDAIGRYFHAMIVGDELDMAILQVANGIRPTENLQHKKDICVLTYSLIDQLILRMSSILGKLKTEAKQISEDSFKKLLVEGASSLPQDLLNTAIVFFIKTCFHYKVFPFQNIKITEVGLLYNLLVFSRSNKSDSLDGALVYLHGFKKARSWKNETVCSVLAFLKDNVVPASDTAFVGFLDAVIEDLAPVIIAPFIIYAGAAGIKSSPAGMVPPIGVTCRVKPWRMLMSTVRARLRAAFTRKNVPVDPCRQSDFNELLDLPGEIGAMAREEWASRNNTH